MPIQLFESRMSQDKSTEMGHGKTDHLEHVDMDKVETGDNAAVNMRLAMRKMERDIVRKVCVVLQL